MIKLLAYNLNVDNNGQLMLVFEYAEIASSIFVYERGNLVQREITSTCNFMANDKWY